MSKISLIKFVAVPVFCLVFLCSCAGNKGVMSRIGGSLDSGMDTVSSKMSGVYMGQQAKELQAIVAYSRNISLRRIDKMLVVVLEGDTFFSSGSIVLRFNSDLEKVANVLIRYAKTSLSVEGHTDASGSDVYNQKISKLRAEVVRNFLIERSVAPKRIRTLGYGETNPIFENDIKNRRIEIKIALN